MHGGALFGLLRRTRLSGDALELTWRRTLILSGVAWLPLLLLSVGAGRFAGDTLDLPFLRDIETHVCLLIALPLLIGAEVYVHRRIAPVARRLAEGDLLAPEGVQSPLCRRSSLPTRRKS